MMFSYGVIENLNGLSPRVLQGFKNQARTRERHVWNQDRETMEAGVLALIADNSHTVAIFQKGEAVWKGEPEQIGEMVWIVEAEWIEEAHFIFNLKPSK